MVQAYRHASCLATLFIGLPRSRDSHTQGSNRSVKTASNYRYSSDQPGLSRSLSGYLSDDVGTSAKTRHFVEWNTNLFRSNRIPAFASDVKKVIAIGLGVITGEFACQPCNQKPG